MRKTKVRKTPILQYGRLIVRKSTYYKHDETSRFFVEVVNTVPDTLAEKCQGSITLSESDIINRITWWDKNDEPTIDIGQTEFLNLFRIIVFKDEKGTESPPRLYFSHPLSLDAEDEESRRTYVESLDKKLSLLMQSSNASFPEVKSFNKTIKEIIRDAVPP